MSSCASRKTTKSSGPRCMPLVYMHMPCAVCARFQVRGLYSICVRRLCVRARACAFGLPFAHICSVPYVHMRATWTRVAARLTACRCASSYLSARASPPHLTPMSERITRCTKSYATGPTSSRATHLPTATSPSLVARLLMASTTVRASSGDSGDVAKWARVLNGCGRTTRRSTLRPRSGHSPPSSAAVAHYLFFKHGPCPTQAYRLTSLPRAATVRS